MKGILHGDCLELMKEIPTGSIDMILCDLPYGTTQNKWDTVIPFEDLWASYERIIKDNGAIVLTAQCPFDKVLGASNLKLLRYELIWVKNIATGHLNANKIPMKNHENILVFYKKLPTFNPQLSEGKPYTAIRKSINDNGSNYGHIEKRTDTINAGTRKPLSVLNFKRETGIHPTQKPVPLFEYLIRSYTNEGDTVLDNCAGSFTTAIAAINSKRKFICIEREQKYFDLGSDRVYKHLLGDMF